MSIKKSSGLKKHAGKLNYFFNLLASLHPSFSFIL